MTNERGLKPELDHANFRSTKLTIRGRLIIGFLIMTIIVLLSATVTLLVVNSTRNYTNKVLNTDLPAFTFIVDLGSQVAQLQLAAQGWVHTQNQKYIVEYNRITKNINSISNSVDKLTPVMNDLQFQNQWTSVKTQLADIQSQFNDLYSKVTKSTGQAIDSEAVISQYIVMSNKLLDLLDGTVNESGYRTGGMYDSQYTQLKASNHEILLDMDNIQLTAYSLILIFIISSIAICLLTSRSIAKHINVFRRFSSKIASRDLRQQLDIGSNDEIGMLGNDLNMMTKSLSSITQEIISASQNMVSTLEEVKQAVNVQSSGATQQASSINEITASLEEIEKSSSQTMEKAKTLGGAAERTREKGQLGLEAVEQSILGMKMVKEKVQLIAQTILDLSQQTQQVGEITAVVNSLAQQSKMLALNASIEAAKAGEAGKGFAVVASEVKNLAEQSEQSTAQVQKILEDIRHATEKAVMVTEEGTKGVDHGTGLVEQTGEIVRNLSEVIHETTVASQQIEAAVKQEGIGIEQIAAGMNEINQVTASFVASAQQTTEAIGNLSGIAKNLKEHVDTYTL